MISQITFAEMGYNAEEIAELTKQSHIWSWDLFSAIELNKAVVLDENLQANIAFGLARMISSGNHDREIYFTYKNQTYRQKGLDPNLVSK